MAPASLWELAQPKHPTSKRVSLTGGISEKGGPRDSMKRSLPALNEAGRRPNS